MKTPVIQTIYYKATDGGGACSSATTPLLSIRCGSTIGLLSHYSFFPTLCSLLWFFALLVPCSVGSFLCFGLNLSMARGLNPPKLLFPFLFF
jgi:hypothetical protein